MRNYEIYQARWQSTGDTTRAKTDDFAHQIHYNESDFGLRIIISAPGHGDGERAGNGVEDCPALFNFCCTSFRAVFN